MSRLRLRPNVTVSGGFLGTSSSSYSITSTTTTTMTVASSPNTAAAAAVSLSAKHDSREAVVAAAREHQEQEELQQHQQHRKNCRKTVTATARATMRKMTAKQRFVAVCILISVLITCIVSYCSTGRFTPTTATTIVPRSNYRGTRQKDVQLPQQQQQEQQQEQRQTKDIAPNATAAAPASPFSVSPLEAPLDYEQFTVRLNTWKRPDQLKVSLHHYSSCAGVAQIQIVWCLEQGTPPDWLNRMVQGTYDWNKEDEIVAAAAAAAVGNASETTTETVADAISLPSNSSTNGSVSLLSPSSLSSSGENSSVLPSYRAPIILELHVNNSLNERFQVLVDPPTKGILSVDDDVLRPCLALDAGFFLWTHHPERLVGYDARTHVVVDVVADNNEDNGNDKNNNNSKIQSDQDGPTDKSGQPQQRWKYGYLSTTRNANQYSLTLTRFSFQHVDYLRGYMTVMPAMMRDRVLQIKNCEDIAMSLWITSVVHQQQEQVHQQQQRPVRPQPPLLADHWAQKSIVKLYVPGGISSGSEHKALRDGCLNDFSELLGLKQLNFIPIEWVHYAYQPFFQSGLKLPTMTKAPYISHRFILLEEHKQAWMKSDTLLQRAIADLSSETACTPFLHGLMPNTLPWSRKFQIPISKKRKKSTGS